MADTKYVPLYAGNVTDQDDAFNKIYAPVQQATRRFMDKPEIKDLQSQLYDLMHALDVNVNNIDKQNNTIQANLGAHIIK